MKTSTAEQNGNRCPECGDELTEDHRGRGSVRHKNVASCPFERGRRDRHARQANRTRRRLNCSPAIIAIYGFFSCSGICETITITNFSFESPILNDGAMTSEIPGWTATSGSYTFNPDNSWYSGTSSAALPAPAE